MAAEPSKVRDTPGVIAPPPILYVAFLALGLLLSWLWPLWSGAPGVGRYVVGGLLVVFGAAFDLAGMRAFRRARTPPEPWKPTTTIVTGGPFRYSRNPMYVGMTLIYVGLAVVFNSLWTLLLVVPLLLVIRYGVVAREEAYMERRFGRAYRDYRASVRRWI